MSRLDEIKERRAANPWFKAGSITQEDVDWLIAEVERLREYEERFKECVECKRLSTKT